MNPFRENSRNQEEKGAWVVSVLMGLGHMRAAYALRDLAHKGLLMYGGRETTDKKERRFLKLIRSVYYFMSSAGNIPVFGVAVRNMLLKTLNIKPLYPVGDQSRASLGTVFLDRLIRKKNLGKILAGKLKNPGLPVINVFYSTAMALEHHAGELDNYLVICDADINRAWAPRDPSNSRIKYLAPCTRVKMRLMRYGVKEENIYLTGFPLPKENIGSAEEMETLKDDLYRRLRRLDPSGKFTSFHKDSIKHNLGKELNPEKAEDYFYLTFAVGGAGAHCGMIRQVIEGLRESILDGRVRLNISAGIKKDVFESTLRFINRAGLTDCINDTIKIVFDDDVYRYLDKFNSILRTTDILWTKPSELSFYCGLGIPILLAPAIGPHEEINRKWLQAVHTGIEPPGPVKYVNQWLFDLRDNGRFAEAAWDGFVKVRKLGAYEIENLITEGHVTERELAREA